jgi:hypothetical protein
MALGFLSFLRGTRPARGDKMADEKADFEILGRMNLTYSRDATSVRDRQGMCRRRVSSEMP